MCKLFNLVLACSKNSLLKMTMTVTMTVDNNNDDSSAKRRNRNLDVRGLFLMMKYGQNRSISSIVGFVDKDFGVRGSVAARNILI